ncbi:MAG TPA: sugar ABC transporter permease [Streptosporangiales bacterium]
MPTATTTARRATAAAVPARRSRDPLAGRRARTAYLFLAPALLFFAVLFFYPLANELLTSLFSGAQAETFSGIGNYTRAFTDPVARHSFLVTVEYAVGVLVLSIVLGIALAAVLNQGLRGRVVMRGILLVPYLTSMAIVGLLWRNILDPEVGVLNRVLLAAGLPTQSWLNTHPLATLVAIAAWQQIGYTTLLFLAGMQGIPETYYEAARVDGAGPWRRFVGITLPLLAPTTLFVSVIGVISALQEFTLPYIVTGGGPGNATDLFVFRTYQTAFNFRDFGYASALSYLLLVVILVLSVVQLRIGRRRYDA